jgi:methionyl-tRNA formyltransferase
LLKFLYVSRQFNRSGYHILNYLLESRLFIPTAVLLPYVEKYNPLDNPSSAIKEIIRYKNDSLRKGFRPLRFHGSIRELALDAGIPVIEKKSIKGDETYEWLKSLNIDLIVLGGGWHELIPPHVIRLPRLGVINTHPSLLPKFRGTDIHRWQVYKGVRQSGTTIHYIDEMFDTGDILAQKAVDICPRDTPQELAEKAALVSGSIMVDVLQRISEAAPQRIQGMSQPAKNDSSQYYSRWRWEDRSFMRVKWTHQAEEITRFVLACTQEDYKYNGPFFQIRNQNYFLRRAMQVSHDRRGRPGEVLRINDEGIFVKCGVNSTLLMQQIQPFNQQDWNCFNHKSEAWSGNTIVHNIDFSVGDIFENEQSKN